MYTFSETNYKKISTRAKSADISATLQYKKSNTTKLQQSNIAAEELILNFKETEAQKRILFKNSKLNTP